MVDPDLAFCFAENEGEVWLAVFCCDEAPERFSPDVTVITNNPKEIAETFWEMFLAAERGEPVESRYTELFIRTGQTVPRRT